MRLLPELNECLRLQPEPIRATRIQNLSLPFIECEQVSADLQPAFEGIERIERQGTCADCGRLKLGANSKISVRIGTYARTALCCLLWASRHSRS